MGFGLAIFDLGAREHLRWAQSHLREQGNLGIS